MHRHGPSRRNILASPEPRGLLSPSNPAALTEDCPHSMRAQLDATDWRILKELQANGRITNVALAARVGLSPPPCLRRVRALEDAGLIRGYHAELDEPLTGFEVT